MVLVNNSSLIGCKVDPVCFKQLLLAGVEVFSEENLTKESDVVGYADGHQQQRSWYLLLTLLEIDEKAFTGCPA